MIFFAALLAHALATPTYAVVNQFHLPGDTGWDLMAVDSDSQRLYISRGTHVQVMATDTGSLVADIPNTQGVHGIAIAHKLGKGFITNGRDDSVSVFDLSTNKETNRIKVGGNPDAILFDSFSGDIFALNARSSDVSIIDAKSEQVVATLKFDGKPELPATDGHGHIYVNLEDVSKVVEIDVSKLKINKEWSLSPGEEPTGIAIDATHSLVFSTCGNGMMTVSDTKLGKVAATAATGSGTDSAGFDPSSGIAFASNGDGTLSLVKEVDGKYTNIQNVATKTSARTMALDEKRHLVYLIAADFDAPKPGERRGAIKPNSTVILVVGPKK